RGHRDETELDGSGVSRGDWSHSGFDTQRSRSSLAWWLVGSRCRNRRHCPWSSYRFKALLLWSGLLRLLVRALLIRWGSLLLRRRSLLWPTLLVAQRL